MQNLELTVQIEARSGRKIDIFAYSGGLMQVADGEWWIVDLSGLDISASVPIQFDHDDRRKAGTATATTDGESLSFSGDVDPVDLAAHGGKQASVGVTATEYTEHLAGELIEINGQRFRPSVAFKVARKSKLKEISVVHTGADQSTHFSITATAARIKDMFGLSKAKTPPAPLTDEQVKQIEAMVKPPANGWKDEKAVELLATQALSGEVDFAAFAGGIVQQIQASYQAGQDSMLDTMHANLRASNGNAQPSTGNTGEQPTSKDIVACALMIKSGHDTTAQKAYGESTLSRANDLRRRRSSDILAAAYRADGNEQAAIAIEAGVGVSTMNLPEVFSDTLHKTAIDMFETTPSTYLKILRRKSHSDFHKSTELRPYSKNGYSEMGKDSEIKHDVLGVATYVSQVEKTFAKQYAVTRHDWIQDSTGFLAAYPSLIASDAEKLVSKLRNVSTTLRQHILLIKVSSQRCQGPAPEPPGFFPA